jgi:3'-phosphoadenosine 5'-phosphosulfate sulfotransferase (PAPS reductase)/FAD synthetase
MCQTTIDFGAAARTYTGGEKTPTLSDYDRFVVFFSGGKDSVACVLSLLDAGIDPALIELHHHIIDGREGSDLMDWPVTEAYCEAFAKAMGMQIYFSWKVGGFEREMLRQDSLTAPIAWETEDGRIEIRGGERGKESTRRKFPQVAADLSVRWCSAYLKVDVGARLLTSEPRFRDGKTLVLTGERAEESSARAKYCTFEPDRSDNRNGPRVQRFIDHWRPIHKWDEKQVWDALKRYRIKPHPAYHCGWGRTSCLSCIFGSKDQWATVRFIAPERFERIAHYEQEFKSTIHRKLSVRQQADLGSHYDADPEMIKLGMGTRYSAADIFTNGAWEYPLGAFGETNGPT